MEPDYFKSNRGSVAKEGRSMSINANLIDQATSQLAEYFVDILADRSQVNKSAALTELFEDYSAYLKANAVTPENDNPQSLTSKLNQMVAASGMPLEVLLHTAHGARLVERLNDLTKKEEPMTRSDEMQQMRQFVSTGGMTSVVKLILEKGSTSLTEWEYTELVQENATHKGISFEKAFQDPDTQRAYKIVRGANQVQTYMKSYPGKMSVEVVSTEVGSTLTSDDSFRAAEQLKSLVEAQRAKAPTLTTEQLYDAVYRDPANRSITARAHPTTSSPSYDAEMHR
jgi:hypothetical protein